MKALRRDLNWHRWTWKPVVTVIMLTVVGFALSPPVAAVTITYTDLHLGQASESSAYAVSGTQQAGRARLFLPVLESSTA